VATNLRHILCYLGPPAASCNFINTMRKGSPAYSIVMAFEDAFRTWEGKVMPHLSEWRPINTSSMSLRSAAQGHTFQSTIHSPAWMDLVHRSRGRGLVSKKGLQISTAIYSQWRFLRSNLLSNLTTLTCLP